MRKQHSHFPLETRCAFATSLRFFSHSRLKLFFFNFLWVDFASFMCDWDKPRFSFIEFRACALLLPNVSLALLWRSSGGYIHTSKNAHIFEHAENVRIGWRTRKMKDVHQAFSSNHQRILTHAQQITTHWPKFVILCALDVRDGMCDWAFSDMAWKPPNKHDALTQCWFYVGPPSVTLAQRKTSIGSIRGVCWAVGEQTEWPLKWKNTPASPNKQTLTILYNICTTSS